MKKIVSCLMLLMGIGWIVGGQTVYAEDNSMSLIEYDVKLLENGTGIITEHRKMNMTEGTELYIEMNNLQGSEVTDFSVQGFSYNPDWNLNDSREEKAGEYGVLESDEGVELVWGIGEYGEREYELTYTITNMVRQLEDGQALNWNFNTYGEIAPEAMSLTINGPFAFNQENVDIWGFGYEGVVELENGRLTSAAQAQLEPDGRLVILMQFSGSPFNTTVQDDQTLQEQLAESQDGATYNGDGKLSGWLLSLILGIVIGIPSLLGIVFWRIEVRKKEAGKMRSGYALKKRNKGQTYGDIPYTDGDIFDVSYLLQQIQHGTFEDYFFAYLLKWSKEERIKIHTKETDGWLDKEDTVIELLQRQNYSFNKFDNEAMTFEEKVWSILEEVADLSGKVSEKDMKKWSKKHAKELSELATSMKDESKDILEAKGYIRQEATTYLGMKLPFISATREGERLFDRVAQFENHLNDLKLDESLSYKQTLPWEEFIIWATLYGKGSDVVESLEKFYPEQWNDWVVQYPYFYGGYHGLYGFSHSMSSGMESGGYNAATGAGGSTSIGGGGGAIGGGGGGAR
ncbi:Predicted membrane protein [Marinilactibacillus piezotolerans]|uniref:Predicted membrane protein n=1 Tax=Marinilactibacillus piezotolerans TaxID=258723 RepID=A0A1I3YST4_9LACT|nr:DUF2207 domain-containing protein [Marinilactibacillus piezotolerans]SFK34908.1 Predicted membrane protein [Marinilactibacillus piezotolerans]